MKIKQEKQKTKAVPGTQCLSLDLYPAFRISELMLVSVIHDEIVPSRYSRELPPFQTLLVAFDKSQCRWEQSYYKWFEFFGSPYFSDIFQI